MDRTRQIWLFEHRSNSSALVCIADDEADALTQWNECADNRGLRWESGTFTMTLLGTADPRRTTQRLILERR